MVNTVERKTKRKYSTELPDGLVRKISLLSQKTGISYDEELIYLLQLAVSHEFEHLTQEANESPEQENDGP